MKKLFLILALIYAYCNKPDNFASSNKLKKEPKIITSGSENYKWTVLMDSHNQIWSLVEFAEEKSSEKMEKYIIRVNEISQ